MNEQEASHIQQKSTRPQNWKEEKGAFFHFWPVDKTNLNIQNLYICCIFCKLN